MPFPLLLALRYLKSTRRDAFASFLSAVAACGIALGVAALILVLALLSGFQEALSREVLGRTLEIEVEMPAEADLDAAREVAAAVPGVTAAHVVLHGQGWLTHGALTESVELFGYDGAVPDGFPGATGGEPGLYLSSSLALRWGVVPGETVNVVSARSTLTPFGPQPRVRTLPVTGIFESSAAEEQERVALPRAQAESLLGIRDRRLAVSAGGLEEALEVAPAVADALGEGAQVRTWRELNRALLFALKLEKRMTFVAVSLVVLVASLALVADLALIISNKQREIGMLGAMGARGRTIRRAFLWLGGLLALGGITSGALLGVGAAFLLDRYRLLTVPGQVYFIDYVPFRVEVVDLTAVLALTALLALVSAGYAARRATTLTPVEALER